MTRHGHGHGTKLHAQAAAHLEPRDDDGVAARTEHDEHAPPPRRAPLPPREAALADDAGGMTHEDLVRALRGIDGLVDVGRNPPNFHFRARPFLHFHHASEGTYADVRFGSGDFEPVWASTAAERQELLARVWDHVERADAPRKAGRSRSRR